MPKVLEVIDLCAKYDLTLETGHSSPQDGIRIVREANKRGVRHIVVTHAMVGSVRMSIPQMIEASREGALIEFTYSATLGKSPVGNIHDYAQAIRRIGVDNCILASDLGQPGNAAYGRTEHVSVGAANGGILTG